MSVFFSTALVSVFVFRRPETACWLGFPTQVCEVLRRVSPWYVPAVYFLYLLYKYRNRAIGTRPCSLHGPREHPLIGSLIAFQKYAESNLDLLLDWRQQFGLWHTTTLPFMVPIVILNLQVLLFTNIIIKPRWIHAYDVATIEHILRDNFQNYVKGPTTQDRMYSLLGNGIFNTNGDQWRMQRKTAAHIFTVKTFREITTGVFQDGAKTLASILDQAAHSGQDIDLHDLFFRFTFDSFGKISFGSSFDSLRGGNVMPFMRAFDFAQDTIDRRFRDPFFRITEFITGRGRKMEAAVKVLDNYAFTVIDARRQNPDENRKRDLLDLFMEYRHEDGSCLSDRELRDIVVNFMIAGRDTTAQQLSWQYLTMMQQTEIQDKLREELSSAQDKLDYESVKELHYSTAVFNETLRLYPPVPKNHKTAVNDDVLPCGIHVKKGDLVLFSPYVMARDKQIWGENAAEFDPERWLIRDAEGKITGVRKESHCKFNTFNAGPRVCPGQMFAVLKSLTLTAELVKRFRFELSPKFLEQERLATEPLYGTSVTLPMRRPLWVRVHRL
ncbi:uncharacterized protein VTP21DRAFT_5749 [Calcarisporiella thermophila]|uniref:uncharacterized protein n=1 Tax=Calcarisporiella thermophila TaxID=911321 RepID=UPI0037441A91